MKIILGIIGIFWINLTLGQELTGTWEGEFIKGEVGLRQTSKMRLELVEIEGKVFGIFSLFPIDTKVNDEPNVIYTVEGTRGNDHAIKFALYKGDIVESSIPETPRDFFQFTVNVKSQTSELTGKWYYELEPLNSRERGAGSFKTRKVTDSVSDHLKSKKKEQEILKKLNR